MKLALSAYKLSLIITARRCTIPTDHPIETIFYDSRRIHNGSCGAFFALKGTHTDGHHFISDAYKKNVRTFVISQEIDQSSFPDACFLLVNDVMSALFQLANYWREKLKGTLVLISGQRGKTSVKEWIYHFLSPEFRVSRSPKSYNSELGIILSLLTAQINAQIVLIEVKPHKELNPEKINQLIAPDIGILTSPFSSTTQQNFFIQLYKGCSNLFHAEEKLSFPSIQTYFCSPKMLSLQENIDKSRQKNVAIAQSFARYIGLKEVEIEQKTKSLPDLALRMDTFKGKRNNFIINDLYNLDRYALQNSLEFQQSIAQNKKKALVIELQDIDKQKQAELEHVISQFNLDYIFFYTDQTSDTFLDALFDTVILIKGTRPQLLMRIVNKLRLQQHQTQLNIDLKALRKNITTHRQIIPEGTKMMAMLKAAGYGSGIDKIAQFIDGFGVDYFGVAFVDEGITIREAGIKKPIMVMNTQKNSYQSCIEYNLEPAIFDLQQLDDFIAECIYQNKYNYPVHIKLNTGMNRLGFEPEEINQLIENLLAQPEVKIQSVYSHLAEADNVQQCAFTCQQIEKFTQTVNKIRQSISYFFDTHILNSSGIENFPNAHFSMVRLGIGMYGIASNPAFKDRLEPVISWTSVIVQLRKVATGQSVGYGRIHRCTHDTIVATIPVGYADGLARSLGNNVGYLTINDVKCPIIGAVCMDMTLIDATEANAQVGDLVEIIGKHCSLEQMANLRHTIPYEIMTSISERVHKVYIET